MNNNTNSELIEHLVSVRRVAKVVKGGRRFRFCAFVVVGDGKGRVGFGSGKAGEVLSAKTKAVNAAKKNIIKVPLKNGKTLHHEALGKHCSGKVLIRPARAGTGVIAGGSLRPVFECLGIQDIVAKSLGSTNSYNLVKACFCALETLGSPKSIAERRGIKVSDLTEKRQA